jgi:hypothetical protein
VGLSEVCLNHALSAWVKHDFAKGDTTFTYFSDNLKNNKKKSQGLQLR